MTKALQLFSRLVLTLTFLSLFAYAIVIAITTTNKLGIVQEPLKAFANFPGTVYSALKSFKNPERLVREDPNFERLNHLDYDVFALNSLFANSRWNISLTNLKDDEVIHEWYIEEKDYKYTGRNFSHSEPKQPILFPDKSLVFATDESKNLYRIDKDSKIMWKNSDFIFHHSVNPDHEGNIWVCTREQIEFKKLKSGYWDNSIVKIDKNTGKVLFNKSITEIFLENNLLYFIHGMNNSIKPKGTDPQHLNDIEAVFEDGPYWKKGDVFLSLRNRSLIVLYRPSTNKIIRTILGPFYSQHDVDIISDSTISIFNNNISRVPKSNYSKTAVENKTIDLKELTLNHFAEVVIYNFKDSTFKSLYSDQFIKEKIFTITQGVHRILANGDVFVESQNNGKIFIFNEEDFILKDYINQPKDNLVEPPHWIRLYENLEFLQ